MNQGISTSKTRRVKRKNIDQNIHNKRLKCFQPLHFEESDCKTKYHLSYFERFLCPGSDQRIRPEARSGLPEHIILNV